MQRQHPLHTIHTLHHCAMSITALSARSRPYANANFALTLAHVVASMQVQRANPNAAGTESRTQQQLIPTIGVRTGIEVRAAAVATLAAEAGVGTGAGANAEPGEGFVVGFATGAGARVLAGVASTAATATLPAPLRQCLSTPSCPPCSYSPSSS
ncbi:hypothetical protein CVT25_001196 [Psilocybe cyanescens]|uniref:Uncharacterized protein n=1 Tax=Psilocybe cyanescens TaxID=93625 RepID=A0A409XAV0_PSICY|nr:hypothetical protein CVT25_001196 [Psilocybe cyanescens]